MKKTLATLLVVALVASLCGVMFVSAEAVNLVAGKTYEISEQFHMSTVTWGYDESYPASYPDDGNELTDGLIPEAVYSEAGWMAFNKQTPAQTERGYAFINFDLGAVCDLDEVKLTTLKDTATGITCPYDVSVYVSNDGETYEQAGSNVIETEDLDALADNSNHVISISLDASAQYIQLRVVSYGWAFLGEVEVLGTAPAGDSDDDDDNDGETMMETIVVDGKLDDTGYTNAVWFSDGIWQGQNDPQTADLDIAYTVRSDDNNIYLTIKVNQGVDFDTPLDLNAWNQVGATDFRIWLKGDGMESRTFYDLLWDGEVFVPFRQKVATEELTFAAGTGENNINMEIAIAKSSLSITDSFQLMVTYSSPYCGDSENFAYNAFHMTACEEMPSGWSSNTDAYETYVCEEIALKSYKIETGETKTWDETLTIGEDGNAVVEVPYGYTWTVSYVDGKIVGEDVTICTTDDAYKACNPNWAITILLNKQEDGTYVAAQDAIVTPGNADAITVGENQIALVVHSASSNPDGGYANWEGKVVAVSVKAGDVFNVDLDGLTVSAIDPNAPVEPEQPDTPITGDTGILVFAVLAVVAVAGCAVASKIKSSAL